MGPRIPGSTIETLIEPYKDPLSESELYATYTTGLTTRDQACGCTVPSHGPPGQAIVLNQGVEFATPHKKTDLRSHLNNLAT
jgi:hypothetical protein